MLLTTVLLTIVTAPQPKPPQAQAPSKSVDRTQPQGYKPYLHPKASVDARYYARHGHRFRDGYWYQGYRHSHWSYHYYDRRYGAYLYYDPGVKVYYWWCAPHFRYYPVSYLPAGMHYGTDYEEEPKEPKTPPPAPPPYEGKE